MLNEGSVLEPSFSFNHILLGGRMDQLMRSAKQFECLTGIQYRMLFGRKQTIIPVTLKFHPTNYYHLSGLHKIPNLVGTTNSERIYNMILEGIITEDAAKNHEVYSTILDRIDILCRLEELLDSEHVTYKYLEKKNLTSRIKADLLIHGNLDADNAYFFAKVCGKDLNTYEGISTFKNNYTDYTYKQAKISILYKEKLTIKTNEKIVIKPCEYTHINIKDYFL